MKRSIIFILIVAACVVGFLSIRGTMPFLPVFGTSMEPTLKAGNLILIDSTLPSDIEEGDIIVFSVPPAVRDYYNYPPLVAHRVIRVTTEPAISYRTKGDNAGEDPFTVRAQDVKGVVGQQIPYLGFPLLFLQSQQGLIFVAIALSLLGFYFFSTEINQGRQTIHRRIFSPVVEENRRTNRVITQRMENAEKAMTGTQDALLSFSSAMSEYAVHLKSHTSAVQGLSDASQDLKKSTGEQTRVLGNMVKVMEQAPPRIEPKVEPKVEPAVKHITVKEPGKPPVEHTVSPSGAEHINIEVKVEPRIEPKIEPIFIDGRGQAPSQVVVQGKQTVSIGEGVIAEPEEDASPPGCYRNRREPVEQETLSEKHHRVLQWARDFKKTVVEKVTPAEKEPPARPDTAIEKEVIKEAEPSISKHVWGLKGPRVMKPNAAARHTLSTRETLAKKQAIIQKKIAEPVAVAAKHTWGSKEIKTEQEPEVSKPDRDSKRMRIMKPGIAPKRTITKTIKPVKTRVTERKKPEKEQEVAPVPGTIVWRQGFVWKMIPPPYDMEKAISLLEPPEGAVRTNLRTPKETIQVIGGPVPHDVSLDLGVVDVFIEAGGKNIRFTGGGLKTDIGKSLSSSTKGLSVPTKPSRRRKKAPVEADVPPSTN